MTRIARILAAHGWRREGGGRLDDRDVYPVWNRLWNVLAAVGTPDREAPAGEFLPRIPGSAARALIRDALFSIVTDVGVSTTGAAFRRGGYRPVG